MTRIALADRYTLVRWALREALSGARGFEIVGEAGTATETIDMVQRVQPDVLLLEPSFPDRSGIDMVDQLRQLETAPLIIVLTARTEPSWGARIIAAGAHGYVHKSMSPQELVDAIGAVTRGERFIPPAIERMLETGDADPASVLTARELQVMDMLARGLTTHEIAEHFALSVKTVDTHRLHVLKKLGLRNASELTAFAVRHGYIVP